MTGSESWDMVLALLGGYLLGSIPASFLIARAFGVDIRTVGSGNVGATNVLRALGPKAGVPALICDALKGTLAVLLARALVPGGGAAGPIVFPLVCGVAAVVGHSFTIWLRFKGGKGVATGAGMFAALAPVPLAGAVAVFVTIVLITRYVSLASMVSALALNAFIAVWMPESRGPLLTIALPLALFICWRHRDNVRRLLSGTEARLGQAPAQAPETLGTPQTRGTGSVS
jgi:glycerol-3-phosphate acyltransferase PlsY